MGRMRLQLVRFTVYLYGNGLRALAASASEFYGALHLLDLLTLTSFMLGRSS